MTKIVHILILTSFTFFFVKSENVFSSQAGYFINGMWGIVSWLYNRIPNIINLYLKRQKC